MGANYEKAFYKEYEELFEKNRQLNEKLNSLKYEHNLLVMKFETSEKHRQELADRDSAKDVLINEMAREIERLRCLLNTDGTNSGIPTSKTPINKAKLIPNSREKTDRKIGGQHGHAKRKLERFPDSEVNMHMDHSLDECPECHGANLEKTGIIEKDCLDYRVVVEKIRHTILVYRCPDCGKEVHVRIPDDMKEENQYGTQVQALALTLMNQGNVSLNKVRKIIHGFTGGEIHLSEGYLCKLQKRAAISAWTFCEDLRRMILNEDVVHWDDTVIMVNTNRACLRYYGTENLALYKAHMHKDKEGLDKDNILKLLPPTTTVVHDHNKVNYNDDYSFQNAECNEHLLRDLKKVQDNLGHKWASDLAKLLADTNKERESLIEEGVAGFPPEVVSGFFESFNRIILDADEENKNEASRYYSKEEKTLLMRLLEYKNEYLAWVLDFDLPFTNNLSERSLRDAKSKMKISGQFQNVETASFYANIKSYLETCYRNGINMFYALLRLCRGNPISLNELLHPPQA